MVVHGLMHAVTEANLFGSVKGWSLGMMIHYGGSNTLNPGSLIIIVWFLLHIIVIGKVIIKAHTCLIHVLVHTVHYVKVSKTKLTLLDYNVFIKQFNQTYLLFKQVKLYTVQHVKFGAATYSSINCHYCLINL